jgi:GNAT superfamily N-acetyltransferase
MASLADYSAVEKLRDGATVIIRAFRSADRANFLSAVDRVGPRSRYLRFFALKQDFSEREKSFFLDVDFDSHVALIAVVSEDGRDAIVGGGRYVLVQPGKAEVAFVVVDKYQGQGIGGILLRHLIAVARMAGLQSLVAEVLPENAAMLSVFNKCGLPVSTTRDSDVVHVTVSLRLT